MNEFTLIKKFFAAQGLQRDDVNCGIGDDAAILTPPPGHQLAMTTDTLVSGVHFPTTTSAYDIGYKSLAVNLSDLAAMGATPAWVLLSITLPKVDQQWIEAFCDGFFTLANRYQTQLVGGDLTHADQLSITVQATGWLPQQQALLRSQAKTNDLIYVSGTLGDAALGLTVVQNKQTLSSAATDEILIKLNRPEPRVSLGQRLLNIATAAIDVSDGLGADLGHILEESNKGAIVYVDRLPLSPSVKESLTPEEAIHLALTGGDDYELCFTIPPNKQADLEQQLADIDCAHTCIGVITEKSGLDLQYQNGNPYHGTALGYRHF